MPVQNWGTLFEIVNPQKLKGVYFMKTQINTNLKRSKLALLFATIFAVAIVSVAGFCFTNANADNSAESANAEWSIPVTNLFSGKGGVPILFSETEWSLEVSKPPIPRTEVKDNPYLIQDNDHELRDDKASEIYRQRDMLVVTLVSVDSDSNTVYKSWAFSGKESKFDWYLVENGTPSVITDERLHLNPTSTNSIYYGRPESFNVKSTGDIESISGFYRTFSGDEIQIKTALPASFDLTGQVEDGYAYYIEDKPGSYKLVLKFKDPLGRDSVYQIECYAKDGKYQWLYNEKPVSTNPNAPTPISRAGSTTNTFTVDQAPEPKPITSFKVTGTVVDKEGKPIPNASIGFYNSDVDLDLEEPLISTLSAEDGSFVLDGCYSGTTDPRDLKITYTAKHYDSDMEPISYEEAETGEVDLGELDALKDAVLDLYSDSPEHKSFTVTAYYQEKGEDQPELLFCRTVEYFGKAMDENSNEENYIFDISDNGVITNVDAGEYGTTTTTVVPNGQDGYKFDNYLINDKTTYRAGDSVDIMEHMKADSYARVAVNYTAADGDAKISQTGDASPFVVLSIVAIAAAAGAVFVLRRRGQQL